MSDLDNIVRVSATVTDKSPTRASFGTPLFADYHTAWLDYVREYGEADEMLDDGFFADSPLYNMALKAKSQDPALESFKIGRLATPYTQTVHLLPATAAIAQGFEFELTIHGEPISYVVPSTPTLAAVVTALELLVEAVAGVTSSADSTKVTSVANAGVYYDYMWARGMNVFDATADPGIAADLALIADEDDDWYGLALVPNSKAITLAAAGWIEAKTKQFISMSGDWDVADAGQTTDVATALKNLAYSRTGLIWHRGIGGTEWINAAWMGVQLAADPGSATPAFKTLAGVTQDELRTGEISAIEGKNASWYAAKHGIGITYEGKAASGRFQDVTRFVDWMKETMQVDVFQQLVNNKKVKFSQSGLDSIGLTLENAIIKGIKADGIDGEQPYSVTVPRIGVVPLSDKAARRARDFKFRYVLSGALHGMTVEGTISV